jgi:ferrous iron transport protein A
MTELRPLSETPVGQRLRLVRVDGGQRLKRRLMALGISVGGQAELLQRRAGGVVLASGGNRVAIGAGIAHRLYVEAIE